MTKQIEGGTRGSLLEQVLRGLSWKMNGFGLNYNYWCPVTGIVWKNIGLGLKIEISYCIKIEKLYLKIRGKPFMSVF